MPERHELDAFLTLAEELPFGRTAERLHLSTTRVSRTIGELERRIGVPLFNRTSRRVELTAVGRQSAEEVRPSWARIDAAFERAVDTGRGITGTLSVAFVGAAAWAAAHRRDPAAGVVPALACRRRHRPRPRLQRGRPPAGRPLTCGGHAALPSPTRSGPSRPGRDHRVPGGGGGGGAEDEERDVVGAVVAGMKNDLRA